MTALERQGFRVAAIKPFWRYAVALRERPDLPAIPYYTKSAALAWMDEVRADLPWTTPLLLRHRRFRRVEVQP